VPTQKWYVGKTRDLKARVRRHQKPATAPTHLRPDLIKYTTDPNLPFTTNFTVLTLTDSIDDEYEAHKLEALWTAHKRALYPTGYVAITGNPYASGRLHGLRKHGVYVNPPRAAHPA
jgi:predicted GIY-YIG superfamily endonuclease